ncbi:MAG TPA: FAD-dependent oxidoreductase [Streptosporangiaceae bacterium]|jgi:thioredoxin reductase (NADPH)|nr:FAD-dependent oxidoreductase [Streptosporangiaceae bacterium]
MFDYDARPATAQVVLVGTSSSRGAYEIRDFLARNGRPFEWVDARRPDAVQAALGVAEVTPSSLPVCVLPDGSQLASATVESVAAGLGMLALPSRSEYDLIIVGAGPAGLGAAVNAASEGLSTIMIEAVAPGGQAGTTSMIENYLGFPSGISGSELATRAAVQAGRFGAELLLARPLVDVTPDGPGYVAALSDGTRVRGRALLFASGVEWRRLEVAGIDDLLGAGVYYGAGPSEALACTDSQVLVVGGGNSAGQAVVRFSRYAQKVTLLVRAADLAHSMSQYLIDRISELPNVDIRVGSQVTGFDASDRLRAVSVSSAEHAQPVAVPADALFVCIGGTPRTDGAGGIGLAMNQAGYLVTGRDSADEAAREWVLDREPMPLETNLPGVFAAGDVRFGSVKRCAAAIGEGSMAVALAHRRLAELNGD